MKTCEDLPENILDDKELKPLLNKQKSGIGIKAGKYLKKFMYLIFLAKMAFCFTSCVPGYIATEPVYVESTRPQTPSPLHIWIEGNWLFNRQSHTYVHEAGYWQKPNQNRKYVSGHWQKTPHGSYWVASRWQRQGYSRN